MRKLLITLLLCVLPTVAHAGHVYVKGSGITAGYDGFGSGGTARQLDGVSYIPQRMWCFDQTSANQSATGLFWYPSDNASNTFQPTLTIAGLKIPNDNLAIKFGLTMVVNVDGADLPANTGVAGVVGQLASATFTAGLPYTTKTVSPFTAIPAWNAVTNTHCSGTTTCQNHLVGFRIQRINTNDVCTDNATPYDCCTGAGTGSCAPSSTYAGEVCIQGIDFRY